MINAIYAICSTIAFVILVSAVSSPFRKIRCLCGHAMSMHDPGDLRCHLKDGYGGCYCQGYVGPPPPPGWIGHSSWNLPEKTGK